jgi:hypothetical protein
MEVCLQMSKLIRSALVAASISVFAAVGMAQDTKKEVIVNQDGTYTVIEYPVGKEVAVTLTPSTVISTARGNARVIRSADGTKIALDLSDLPADATSYYAYAVDPSGVPTLLGPITIAQGVAKAEFTTPMDKFMLVVSPAEGLTAVNPTSVVFTSAVPTGYAVVPKSVSENRIAEVAGVTKSAYTVPMLNVPTFGEDEKEVKMKFTGELDGLEAKAYIDREEGTTKIKMKFDDMKKVPANKRFVLWTYSPDGKYTKLGQIVNAGNRDEAEIKSETSLTDFGLFITAEDTEVTVPTSPVYSVFTVGVMN